MLTASDFHAVYWVAPHQGKVQGKLVGKYFFDGHRVAVLDDHYGFLRELPHEGVADPKIRRFLDRLTHSSYLRVVTKGGGQEPRVQPSLPSPPAPDQTNKPSSRPSEDSPVFDYVPAGHTAAPRSLQVLSGVMHVDGKAVDPRDADTIMSSIRSGESTVRYRVDRVSKMEEMLSTLTKGEKISLAESMNALRAAVQAGQIPQQHYDNIRRELFEDEMVPGLGNRKAFREHMESDEGRGGVHIMVDMDNLKSLNDTYGHSAGDAAIRAWGTAMRSAVDKTVGSDVAKVHRYGGDEGHIHVQTHDQAAQVLRQLRSELDAVPPVGGTHKLASSIGIGTDLESADKALYHAKERKGAIVRSLGGDPTNRTSPIRSPHTLHVHSLVPGHEGPVSLDEPSPLHELPRQPPVASPVPDPTTPGR